MEVTIFKHPSILFATHWNLIQNVTVFKTHFEILKLENHKKTLFLICQNNVHNVRKLYIII
jgi:hypothetical protein